MIVTDVPAAVRFLRETSAPGEAAADGPSEITVGDSMIMVSGAGARELFPALLYVDVDDAHAAFRRALAAGAEMIEPPRDTPYGDRRAMVRDPLGNVYQVAHRSG
jgi:PhnB protein